MGKSKNIPEFKNYDEMAEFWDSHSLADYWDQTEPAEFEISKDVPRLHLVSIDRVLLKRVQNLAQTRGLTTESLVNLLLDQRLNELDKASNQLVESS